MAERASNLREEFETAPGETPRHGYRGEPGSVAGAVPAALTVALSREAGSRGGSIAGRAAAKLGWQVYSQDLLEYIAQEGNFRQDLFSQLSPAAVAWVDEHLDHLLRQQNLSRNPNVLNLGRIILALGAQGEAVLLGRGAGCVLPARSTLHVRLVAPLEDRIAYMSQWMRLTIEEATEQVRIRDERRAEFLATHFHRQPGDLYQYDLVLNTSLLGEEACADLIAQAARGKMAGLFAER